MKDNGKTLIEISNLKKDFLVGNQTINVLRGISLKVNKGDFVILFGPSGCGKSTLLHIAIGLEKPTEGKVFFDGKDLYQMAIDDIVRLRKIKVGVVFQQPVWVKSLNVLENVSMPNRLKGIDKKEAEKIGLDGLEKMGLLDWATHHPSELSSGQQQRVALARALTTDPLLIVADEPTGNLDTVSGDELMNKLMKLNKKEGRTILMITHDLEYLAYANKLFHIIDGKLVEKMNGKQARRMARIVPNKKGKRGKLNVTDAGYLKENKKYVASK